MESIEFLRAKLRDAEEELKKITIKRHGSTAWNPGVQDQYASESYSYEEYTDPKKANELKSEIAYLQNEIKTYPERAKAQREREEEYRNSMYDKYEYVRHGVTEETTNPAIAAKYNAQQRLFGMSKFKKALVTITGQKRKFKILGIKAVTPDEKKQQQVADELNKMFR